METMMKLDNNQIFELDVFVDAVILGFLAAPDAVVFHQMWKVFVEPLQYFFTVFWLTYSCEVDHKTASKLQSQFGVSQNELCQHCQEAQDCANTS